MRVTFKNEEGDKFKNIKEKLEKNLLNRLDDVGNMGDPEPYPFLSDPICNKLLAKDSYPLDFTILGFAFKDSKDPAEQYPLRRIQACTANQACISAGCDLSGSDLGKQISLDVTAIARISKITSYYCQTKSLSSDEAGRYGRRLVAFVISYMPVLEGAEEVNQLFAAPGSLFDQARKAFQKQGPQDPLTLLQMIQSKVDDYNRKDRNIYQIWPQVNDDGLKMLVNTNSGEVRRSVVNLAYRQFEGQSRTYINNVSILTAIPNTTQVKSLFQGLEEINFDIPFIKNPLDFIVDLTLERSITDTVGSVTIYQKSSMHSFKIPGIKIAGVDLSGVYSYSSGEQFSRQKQHSVADGLKNTLKMSVPQNAYVVRGFPAQQQYVVSTVVGLIYQPGQQPKFEISIPTGTPFLIAGSDADLASAILGFI